jgi:hypothetical protein
VLAQSAAARGRVVHDREWAADRGGRSGGRGLGLPRQRHSAPGDDPVELAARVLSDHENAPDCICAHPQPGIAISDRGATTASMIWELEERRLHVCAGAPCEGGYRLFSLA